MCQMPLSRPTLPALTWASGEYRWFEIEPPFVIQFVVGKLESSLAENAGATLELLLPPQPAATAAIAATTKAAIAMVGSRFI
jgi:hypothetical protein